MFATPIRLLTAVPICDGHDSAINTINLELIRHGVEVIYLGYHRPAADIVRAAIQEDVRAVGLSSYNGGHVEFFADVRGRLNARGSAQVGLFGGGGGTITHEDAGQMLRHGTDRIFFPGTPLTEMIDWIKERYGGPHKEELNPDAGYTKGGGTGSYRDLARRLSHAEACYTRPVGDPLARVARADEEPGPGSGAERCRVIGLTGPGGAGKTTLIDELVLRFLRTRPAEARIAILSHDPSIGGAGAGALLGDRATMIYSQDDRVFMRSMATRGQSGGLSPATGSCLEILAYCGQFDLVIIETVGTGQEAMPFASDLIDLGVLVMNPDYGSRLQLQKIAMLDSADLIIVNKCDLHGARTASAEIQARLAANKRGQRLLATTATRHRDPGVDAVFELLSQTAIRSPNQRASKAFHSKQ